MTALPNTPTQQRRRLALPRSLFNSLNLTDDELIARIRKQVFQQRRAARILTALFAAGFLGTLYIVCRCWRLSLSHTFDPGDKFHHEYGIGLALGFSMGGMLFISVWNLLSQLSLALGLGWVRIQLLLIKYHDIAMQQKTQQGFEPRKNGPSRTGI